MTTTTDPGSFRDWDSRVLIGGDAVHRVLSPKAWEDWQALAASGTFARASADGRLVPTAPVRPGEGPDGTGVLAGEVGGVLRHERVPVISYPYEWTFSMLKDAALLQLSLTREGIDDGLMVKDATPYNVQWRGARPQFVDVGSFERLRPGEPWPAYRQFCMQFLYPLMLQAYRDLDIQPLLRGRLDGIAPPDAAKILKGRDKLRKGVLTNVTLHARLERKYAEADRGDVEKELKPGRFKPEILKANIARQEKLVRSLHWGASKSEWSGYRDANTYGDEDNARKREFVRSSVEAARPRLAWDIGANDGAYSRIAAEHADLVLAVDIDHLTVEQLYRDLQRDPGRGNILPLVFDLADPSPGLGWRNRERGVLEERARPDHVLALAVIHHVCIGRNVPVAEFVGWLADQGASGVVEWVDRDDPMGRRLLSRKGPDAAPDYTPERFLAAVREHFEIVREERLPSGTRVLYDVRPRQAR